MCERSIPSPATHAILRLLKAGESVISDIFTHKNSGSCIYVEEHNHCFMHYFGVKTLSETPCSPPLMQPGYGARYDDTALREEVFPWRSVEDTSMRSHMFSR